MNSPKCSSVTSPLFSFYVNIKLHIKNTDLKIMIKNHLIEKLPSGFYIYREQHLGINTYHHIYPLVFQLGRLQHCGHTYISTHGYSASYVFNTTHSKRLGIILKRKA